MAAGFNLTAQLQLSGATSQNVNSVLSDLRNNLKGVAVDLKVNTDTKSIARASKATSKFSKDVKSAGRDTKFLNSQLLEASRRFSVITFATGTFIGLARGIQQSVKRAVDFEKELIKISQITGKTVANLSSLEKEIDKVAISLGASNLELALTARTLSQAGIEAGKTKRLLDILGKTTLASSFDNIKDTTEGAIAILNQFGQQAKRTGREVEFLSKSLDVINKLSKTFAVESADLITVVRRTGGVFEAAGGKFEELLALFTSVRQTTRESAETIATGFRTIFTRIQRAETIDQLKLLGITLTDLEGKFVGPLEAIKRLSIGLSTLDPRDIRFNQIVEDLGGFRQIGKVIPLLKQYSVTARALAISQSAVGNTTSDADKATQGLGQNLSKLGQVLDKVVKSFSQSGTFKFLAQTFLNVADSILATVGALKEILPLLATLGAIKLSQFISPVFKGLFSGRGKSEKPIGLNNGGFVPGTGNRDTVPAMLTPGEFVIKKSSTQKIGKKKLQSFNDGGYVKGSFTEVYSQPKGDGMPTFNKTRKNFPKGVDAKGVKRARYNKTDTVGVKAIDVLEFPWNNLPKKGERTPMLQNAIDAYNKNTVSNPQERGDDFEKIVANSAFGARVGASKLNPYGDFLDFPQGEIKSSKSFQGDVRESSRKLVIGKAYNSASKGKGFGKKDAARFTTRRKDNAVLDQVITLITDPLAKSETQFLNSGGIVKFGKASAAVLQNADGNKDSSVIIKPKDLLQSPVFTGLLSKKPTKTTAGRAGAEREFVDFLTSQSTAGKQFDGIGLDKAKSFNVTERLIKPENVKDFKVALEEGLVDAVETTSSLFFGGYGVTPPPITGDRKTNFLSGIRSQIYGDVFENSLRNLQKGGFSEAGTQNQPFDFPTGLGDLTDLFSDGLTSKYVDAKLGKTSRKSVASMPIKIRDQIALELTNANFWDGLRDYDSTGEVQDALNRKAKNKKAKEREKRKETEAGRGFPVNRNSGGGAYGTDTVPAMLTPGEFVVKKSSAQRIGYSNLRSMNKSGVAGFAKGGKVGGVQYLTEGGEAEGDGRFSGKKKPLTEKAISDKKILKKIADNTKKANDQAKEIGNKAEKNAANAEPKDNTKLLKGVNRTNAAKKNNEIQNLVAKQPKKAATPTEAPQEEAKKRKTFQASLEGRGLNSGAYDRVGGNELNEIYDKISKTTKKNGEREAVFKSSIDDLNQRDASTAPGQPIERKEAPIQRIQRKEASVSSGRQRAQDKQRANAVAAAAPAPKVPAAAAPKVPAAAPKVPAAAAPARAVTLRRNADKTATAAKRTTIDSLYRSRASAKKTTTPKKTQTGSSVAPKKLMEGLSDSATNRLRSWMGDPESPKEVATAKKTTTPKKAQSSMLDSFAASDRAAVYPVTSRQRAQRKRLDVDPRGTDQNANSSEQLSAGMQGRQRAQDKQGGIPKGLKGPRGAELPGFGQQQKFADARQSVQDVTTTKGNRKSFADKFPNFNAGKTVVAQSKKRADSEVKAKGKVVDENLVEGIKLETPNTPKAPKKLLPQARPRSRDIYDEEPEPNRDIGAGTTRQFNKDVAGYLEPDKPRDKSLKGGLSKRDNQSVTVPSQRSSQPGIGGKPYDEKSDKSIRAIVSSGLGDVDKDGKEYNDVLIKAAEIYSKAIERLESADIASGTPQDQAANRGKALNEVSTKLDTNLASRRDAAVTSGVATGESFPEVVAQNAAQAKNAAATAAGRSPNSAQRELAPIPPAPTRTLESSTSSLRIERLSPEVLGPTAATLAASKPVDYASSSVTPKGSEFSTDQLTATINAEVQALKEGGTSLVSALSTVVDGWKVQVQDGVVTADQLAAARANVQQIGTEDIQFGGDVADSQANQAAVYEQKPLEPKAEAQAKAQAQSSGSGSGSGGGGEVVCCPPAGGGEGGGGGGGRGGGGGGQEAGKPAAKEKDQAKKADKGLKGWTKELQSSAAFTAKFGTVLAGVSLFSGSLVQAFVKNKDAADQMTAGFAAAGAVTAVLFEIKGAAAGLVERFSGTGEEATKENEKVAAEANIDAKRREAEASEQLIAAKEAEAGGGGGGGGSVKNKLKAGADKVSKKAAKNPVKGKGVLSKVKTIKKIPVANIAFKALDFAIAGAGISAGITAAKLTELQQGIEKNDAAAEKQLKNLAGSAESSLGTVGSRGNRAEFIKNRQEAATKQTSKDRAGRDNIKNQATGAAIGGGAALAGGFLAGAAAAGTFGAGAAAATASVAAMAASAGLASAAVGSFVPVIGTVVAGTIGLAVAYLYLSSTANAAASSFDELNVATNEAVGGFAAVTFDATRSVINFNKAIKDASFANLDSASKLDFLTNATSQGADEMRRNAETLKKARAATKKSNELAEKEGLKTGGPKGFFLKSETDQDLSEEERKGVAQNKQTIKAQEEAETAVNNQNKNQGERQAGLRGEIIAVLGESLGKLKSSELASLTGGTGAETVKNLETKTPQGKKLALGRKTEQKSIRARADASITGLDAKTDSNQIAAINEKAKLEEAQSAASYNQELLQLLKTSAELNLSQARLALSAVNAALTLERLATQSRGINDFLQGTSSAAKGLKNLDSNLAAITGGTVKKDFDTSALDVPINDISADVLDQNLQGLSKTAKFGAGSQQSGLIDQNVANIKEGKGLSDILNTSLPNAVAKATSGEFGEDPPASAQVDSIVGDIAADFAASGQQLSGTFEDLLKAKISEALNDGGDITFEEIQGIRDEIQSLTAEEAAALKARIAISQQFLEAQRQINAQIISLQGTLATQNADIVGVKERSKDRIATATGKERSIGDKERGRRSQAQAQLGVANSVGGGGFAKAGDIGSLTRQQSAISTSRKAKQVELENTTDPTDRGKLEGDLAAMGAASASVTNELKRLSDQSALAADIQGQIAKEQASRRQIGSKVQEFAFGSDEQRSNINQSFLDVNTAIGQGGLEGANDEQRARIGSLLDDFADVEIPGAGGKTGRELKGEFAEKEALRLGLPPELAAAAKDKAQKGSKEEQLVNQLVELGRQEEAAATALRNQTALQISETTLLKNALIANTEAQLQAAGEKAADQSQIKDLKEEQTAARNDVITGGTTVADAAKQETEATKASNDATTANINSEGMVQRIDSKGNPQFDNDGSKIMVPNPAGISAAQDQDAAEKANARRLAGSEQGKIDSARWTADEIDQNPHASKEDSKELKEVKEIARKTKYSGGGRKFWSGGAVYREEGGSIFQPQGTDTVPAMLTPGEFVMRKSAVQRYGNGFMRSINNGSMPGFKRGGLIGTGNVQYRQGGGSINGGGGLAIDPSGISQVLENFNAMFASNLDNIIQAMSAMTGAVNNLASTFSQGMVINHNFTGDLSLAFRIDNADQLKTAIADAIVPRLSEIITEQLDNRLDKDFKSGG